MYRRLFLVFGAWCALGVADTAKINEIIDKLLLTEPATDEFDEGCRALFGLNSKDSGVLPALRARSKTASASALPKLNLALARLGETSARAPLEAFLLESPGKAYEFEIRSALPRFSFETAKRILTDESLKLDPITQTHSVDSLDLADPRAEALVGKFAKGELSLPPHLTYPMGDLVVRLASSGGAPITKEFLRRITAPKAGEFPSEAKYRKFLPDAFRAAALSGPLDDEKLAREVGENLAAHYRSEFESNDDKSPNGLLREIGSAFTEKAKKALEDGFRETFFAKQTDDPCDVVCELADKVAEWSSKKHYETPENFWDKNNEDGWSYALASLGGLFLTKATHCPKGRAALDKFTHVAKRFMGRDRQPAGESKTNGLFIEKLRADLKDSGLKPTEIETMVDTLAKNANATHPAEATAMNPLTSYGNLYRHLFLNGLRQNEGLRAYRGEEKALDEAAKAVRGNLSKMEAALSAETYGSVWHTYLVAAMAVGTANDDHPLHHAAVAKLRGELANSKDPCLFGYLPRNPPAATTGEKPVGTFATPLEVRAERSPRSVTSMFALYLDRGQPPKTKEQATADRDGLYKALGCFHEHGWRAALQVSSAEFHDSGFGNIGSHYFYPNLPYISSAIQALKADPLISAEQRARLATYEKDLLQMILAMRRPGGTFLRMGGKMGNVSSPAYVNPLAGMALMPYCAKRDKALASGVLPKPPTALVEAPPPRVKEPHATF